jgi:hypothetical protein
MSRLIKNFLAFIIPILLLGIFAELLLRNIPNDYSYKKSYLDKNSGSIEVLFLGTSHAYYGINPVFINSNSFNASYISQTLDYDFEILKKYDGHWQNLKYIVIPISYPSLFIQLKASVESWRVKNYTIYYGMFTSNNLADYFELLSNKPQINFERMKSYYLLGKTNITSSELGWGINYNSKNQQDLFESGIIAAKRHTYADDKYFNDNLNILRSIINFADKRHVAVIFYTPPAFHSYVEHLNKGQLNRTIAAMTQLDTDYQNVVYTNFLTDDSFSKKDFYDADHLNEIGAEKLTKKIGDLLDGISR